MNRSPCAFALITLASLLPLLGGCGRPFIPATPPGFADLGSRYPDDEYRSTTAEGVVLGIRAWDNDPNADLPFWSRVVERRIREMGGYALLDKRKVTSRGGLEGVAMRFGHDEGRSPYLYTVVLYVNRRRIFLLEAGGEKAEMTRQDAQIEWAIQNFAAR
jgi:hypothetical protein